MESKQDAGPTALASRSFISGCAAGVVGCIVGHPFDTIKVAQQTAARGPAASTPSATAIARSLLTSNGNGGARGFVAGQRALWAGLGPALAVQVLTSGFLFGAQVSVSATVAKLLNRRTERDDSLLDPQFRLEQAMVVSSVSTASVSGFFTGGVLSVLVCPLEAVKCRSQVVAGAVSSRMFDLRYVRCLYTGYIATVLRCSVDNAAFFGMYALTTELGVNAFVGGALAGASFWVAGMPFDVVKSRMQTATAPLPFASTLRQALREGNGNLRALYAGLPVTLLRAVPMNAAVFFTYEAVKTLSAG